MKRLHNEPDTLSSGADSTFERLFEVAVLLAEGMDRGLVARGLTRARAELIWLLRGQRGMTQRQLSEALRCTPRNVTGLVDGLEQVGLVKREQHATDRRATVVTLTPNGRRTVARMNAEYARAGSEVFADLTEGELSAFSIALKKILTRLRHEPEGPTNARSLEGATRSSSRRPVS